MGRARIRPEDDGVDVALGMIRASLQERELDHNTVVIITSDNGYFAGNHGLGGKTLPYEEGTKAPLVIYDPRRASSGKERARVAPRFRGAVDLFTLKLLPALFRRPATRYRVVWRKMVRCAYSRDTCKATSLSANTPGPSTRCVRARHFNRNQPRNCSRRGYQKISSWVVVPNDCETPEKTPTPRRRAPLCRRPSASPREYHQ